MSIFKKPTTSKFMTENHNDLLDDPEFSNDSPQNRTVKRQIKTEKDFQNLSECKQTPRKPKIYEGIDTCGDSRQRTLNVITRHLQARKEIDENLMKDLTEAITNVEFVHDALNDNLQKLEQLTACFMKCMQQTAAAHKEKLKAFKGIFATFKKECEEIEEAQRIATDKLGVELEEDIYKLRQKLISETKRSEWENLKKSFFLAMHNNNMTFNLNLSPLSTSNFND